MPVRRSDPVLPSPVYLVVIGLGALIAVVGALIGRAQQSEPGIGASIVVGVVVMVVASVLAWDQRRKELQAAEDAREEREATSQIKIFYGPTQLPAMYKEMRHGARMIRAIWSTPYPEQMLEAYFEEEGLAMKETPGLHIVRLVNSNAIPQNFHGRFRQFRSDFKDQLEIFETEVTEFECYVAEYPTNSNRSAVAMFVVNDIARSFPAVGFLLDSATSADVSGAVVSIMEWFDKIAEPAEPPQFLAEPGQSVWDRGADVYDRLVTTTEYSFLRSFLDEEQARLISFLNEVLKGNGTANGLSVTEVGCGTGRSLIGLLTDRALAEKLEHLIGVDTSPAMLEQADENWKKIRNFVPDAARRDITFARLDGTQLHNLVQGGRLVVTELPEEHRQHLDATLFLGSRKVYSCLLNTLGVMHEEERKKILESMALALTPGDRLVISVFDADSFPTQARDLYGHLRRLTGSFDPVKDFDDNRAEFDSAEYYSHWFHQGEIPTLLDDLGLVDITESRFAPGGFFITCSK